MIFSFPKILQFFQKTQKNTCKIPRHVLHWISRLGVAQMVARYLGVVEAAGSNPVTQTNFGCCSGFGAVPAAFAAKYWGVAKW